MEQPVKCVQKRRMVFNKHLSISINNLPALTYIILRLLTKYALLSIKCNIYKQVQNLYLFVRERHKNGILNNYSC